MSDNTTPRPWKAKYLVYTGEYAVLCETEHGDRRVDDKSGGFLEADARLIIRAVNAHDDLMAALQGLLAEPYGCSLCDSGKPRNPAKDHQPDCPYEIARAAITKALGGGQP